MVFYSFPTELILQVFSSCRSIEDLCALSLTCSRFHKIIVSQRLSILENVAETQFGPLHDAVQLVTHNASQPAHIPRKVPFSFALLESIVGVGRVAAAWEELYPIKKWNDNYEFRRVLTDNERYRLRQAVYRLWLYTKAFHNADHPRETRCMSNVAHQRAELLRNWSTAELTDMLDTHRIMEAVIMGDICPSNRLVMERLRNDGPDGYFYHTIFNSLPSIYPPQSASQYHQYFVQIAKPHPTRFLNKFLPTYNHEPGSEGWGDEIPYYYVVEDMLKLNPSQLLWLYRKAPYKSQVLGFVRDQGDWFENNGQTFGQTLQKLLGQRPGASYEDILQAVTDGEMGINLPLV